MLNATLKNIYLCFFSISLDQIGKTGDLNADLIMRQ